MLIEYPTVAEARAAIDGAHGAKLLDQTIAVNFAFVRTPQAAGKGAQGQGPGKGARGGKGPRARSRSPANERAKDKDGE